MNFVLFIIVLGVLIFVHELGHFLVAKKCGMRVDEFGLGFPPRGFVKIFGENPSDNPGAERLEVSEEKSFNKKNRGLQAAVLVAGVSFNIIFAWLVISASFVSGFPAPVGYYQDLPVENPRLVLTQVLTNSPASQAGLRSGDAIVSVAANDDSALPDLTADSVSDFMNQYKGKEILINYERGNEKGEARVVPIDRKSTR